ncbi:protein of unknown function [Bradyrhizobium vignae]|uniref:Uncharacterized protein n=1 Tax=Bradyrhizobium vignae TaxID=1549949 RepID=A0A2U3PXH5_9BRAD|nr:protein of unknown function [Bradyrhizobium vignae]
MHAANQSVPQRTPAALETLQPMVLASSGSYFRAVVGYSIARPRPEVVGRSFTETRACYNSL